LELLRANPASQQQQVQSGRMASMYKLHVFTTSLDENCSLEYYANESLVGI